MKATATGDPHACALLSDGSVSCWGSNTRGELGNNSIALAAYDPVPVLELTGATAITAGIGFTCALVTGGTIKCWGDNRSGSLGNDGGPILGPGEWVTVSDISNATAISAGSLHACALLVDGTVKCWGYNSDGQLGDGTTTTRMTPVLARWSP